MKDSIYLYFYNHVKMKDQKYRQQLRAEGLGELQMITEDMAFIYNQIDTQNWFKRQKFRAFEREQYKEMDSRDQYEYLIIENQLQATNCALEKWLDYYKRPLYERLTL